MPDQYQQHRRNAIQLLTSTLVSGLASLLGLFFSFIQIIPMLAKIHWLAWVAITLGVYLVTSFCIQWCASPTSPLRGIFRIPVWSDLRTFGEQPAARLSYWALVGIPVLIYLIHSKLVSFIAPDFVLPLNLKLTYFASWFIAIALVLFNVACPCEARRKNPFEKVRTVNFVLNNVEKPQIIVEGENEEVPPEVDESLLGFRFLCFSFYAFGTVTFLIVLLRSAMVVLMG